MPLAASVLMGPALMPFTRTVRHAGVAVTADRTQAFLRATSLADAGDRQGVFWAGRSSPLLVTELEVLAELLDTKVSTIMETAEAATA